ncbi:carboxypeptidase-like protein [Nonlabens dokdonensis]|jgi:hypothetical protein|uniref:Carboxypeptidase-like protein n=2 Tax=Nonlabens dokdonensis TaxID=328515 RepID=A0ABX5PYL6_9FLAO|nr:carboxypeptidase-like regulatory domain-containing protein [Nonlabens dokdonensis]AGC77383.1 putative outer membrane protein probably involved in nutrient binding protein [Nonlabens dokdonensis DSW-6]PZX40909.1 carboxypeptidase-like protein [Nonlabens dokdonensis]
MNQFLVLLSFLVSSFCFSQRTITGTVSGPDGETLLGVTISIKGTGFFTYTDFDGKYSIEALPEDILIFNIGYEPTEVKVGNQGVINLDFSKVPHKRTVTGVVSDSDDVLLGATVVVKGTSVFAETDFDGNYSLEASPEDVLVFSYTGYDPQEIVVGNKKVINVTLTSDLILCYFPYVPQNQIYLQYGINYKTWGAYYKNNSNFLNSSIEISYATDFENNSQTAVALEKRIYFTNNFSMKIKASTENADFDNMQYHSYKLQSEKDIALFGSYDFLKLQLIGGYLNYKGKLDFENYGYGIGIEKKITRFLNVEANYINWNKVEEYNLRMNYRWRSWNITGNYKHLSDYEEFQLGLGYNFYF